jgi:hypothetical protein
MIPESPRCTLDMLHQFDKVKMQDVGKTSAFSLSLLNHHIVAYRQPLLAKSPQNQYLYINSDLVPNTALESNQLK